MKTDRLFETKVQRAKRLPLGTWFVWPDTLPKQHKYYQPKVYRVLENHQTYRSNFEDIGIWDASGGVNTAQAAYDRACEVAAHLNAIHADQDAAERYIKERVRANVAAATHTLSEMLFRDRKP